MTLISNKLNQNFIQIINGDKHFSSIFNFPEKLTLGQTLNGKVIDVYPNGRYSINFKGKEFPVETSARLSKGQDIMMKVDQLKPKVNLRIINLKTPKIINKSAKPFNVESKATTLKFTESILQSNETIHSLKNEWLQKMLSLVAR